MKPDGCEIPPLRNPLVPRTQPVPRLRDEPKQRRNGQHPERRPKQEPESPPPAPNTDTTGHAIDLET